MRYRQPQHGGVQLDFNCELLAGGKVLALINGANPSLNLANGQRTRTSGVMRPALLARGVGINSAGHGGGDLAATVDAAGGGIFVDFWYGYWSGYGGENYAYLFGDYDGTNGGGIAATHGGINAHWGYYDGTQMVDSGQYLLPGFCCFVIVRDTVYGTMTVYRDGLPTVTSSVPRLLQPQFAVGSIGENQFAGLGADCSTLLAGRIRFKSWDQRQVSSFTNNPWQLFKSPQRILRSAAGGGGLSLTAAAGLFALTGAGMAMRANRQLSAAAGAFAMTGNASRLIGARKLAPAAGAYALTDNPAGLVAARKLAAAAGVFTLTGATTGLQTSRRLSLGAGTFALSANPATLIYTPLAPPGAYTLAAASGSFTLTGMGVSIRAARRLQAGSASFALAGSTAAMLRGRRLATSSGSFTFAGTAVAIRTARRLAAAVGTFAITGADAVLGFSSSVQYARAPAGSGYAPQRTVYQSRPADAPTTRPADTQRNYR